MTKANTSIYGILVSIVLISGLIGIASARPTTLQSTETSLSIFTSVSNWFNAIFNITSATPPPSQVGSTTIPVAGVGSTTLSSRSIQLGQSIFLNATWGGGVPPYTISVVQSSTSGYCAPIQTLFTYTTYNTSLSYLITPPTTGTFDYCITQTDSRGAYANSGSYTSGVTVSPSTTTIASTTVTTTVYSSVGVLSTQVSPQTIILGHNATVYATWGGGLAPYSVSVIQSYYSNFCDGSTIATIATSAQALSYPVSPSSTGTFYYCMAVTDSKNSYANSGSYTSPVVVLANVVSGTSISVTATSLAPQNINAGQSVTIGGSWTGGTPPYTINVTQSSQPKSCVLGQSLYSTTTNALSMSHTFVPTISGPPNGSGGDWDNYYCIWVTDSKGTYSNSGSFTQDVAIFSGSTTVPTTTTSTLITTSATTTPTTTTATTTIIQSPSSFLFSTLIGSVLNQGVILGSLQNTKSLQSSPYGFLSASDAYSAAGYVPVSQAVTASNGGGISFTTFTTTGSQSYDNILKVSTAQLSSLLNDYGPHAETEYLWLTGFPAYDQASNANNFQLLDAGGAYQIIFNNPIPTTNSVITILGQSYTILGLGVITTRQATVNVTVAGGSIVVENAQGGFINLQSGATFNSMKGWDVGLLWTNRTGTIPNELYSIVIYNTTPMALVPGESLPFIQQSPSAYKLTFIGDTLGSNFDPVTLPQTSTTVADYQNTGTASGITNITEPTELLTVTSSIPNAFAYDGQTGSTLTYDLTPYLFNKYNTASGNGIAVTNVILRYADPTSGTGTTAWISNINPVTVTVIGYSHGIRSYVQQSATFTGNISTGGVVTDSVALATPLYNVTAIEIQGISRIPIFFGGSLNISVVTNFNALLASLDSTSPLLLYNVPGKSYYSTSPGLGEIATYNQQNGQPVSLLSLNMFQYSPGTSAQDTVFDYAVSEFPVPGNSAITDSLIARLYISPTGPFSLPIPYALNYSVSGVPNNVSYVSTQNGYTINVQPGFRTEKGSKVAEISQTQDTFDMAIPVDQLQFEVQSQNAGTTTSISTVTTTIPATLPTWTLQISAGWNLVPTYGVSLSSFKSCQPNTALLTSSLLNYDPATGSYVTSNQTAITSQGSTGTYYNNDVNAYAGWFYSPANCSIQYTPDSVIYDHPPLHLDSGWNFFTIMPWMINQTVGEIFGSCNPSAFYTYRNGAWYGSTSSNSTWDTSVIHEQIFNSSVGYTLITDVPSSCTLAQTTQQIPSPPPIPT